MSEYAVRILLRSDTKTNWENSGSVLKPGEAAIGTVNGLPYILKMGIGQTWNNTPVFMFGFKAIITTFGRNLDNPGGARNASYNITDPNEAFEMIFKPYVAPAISISSPANFPVQEVGVTYSLNQAFTVPITMPLNILLQGGKKKLYVDDVARDLVDQSAESNTNETVNKNFAANSIVDGNVQVLKVHVLNSKDSAQIVATKSVPFNYRSGYFLWPTADDLFAKTDAEITTIIQNLGADMTGVRLSTLNSNGGKSFGTVKFNSTLLSASFYTIYVFNPVSRGTAVMSSDLFRSSPQPTSNKDFTYTKGNASTAYRLSKANDPIQGTYDAYIQ